MKPLSTIAFAILGTAAFSIAPAGSGPLDPPAGPIAPSYRTLAEVEPRTPINATTCPGDADSVFKISQPGSYYLTGNLAGVSGKHGIEIVAGDVTIDLNGFSVVGTPGALDGISVTTAGLRLIAIRNGTIRSWPGDGVDLATSGAADSCLVGLRVRSCTGLGISAGIAAEIAGCTSSENTGGGISTNIGCTVSSCTMYSNNAGGLFANSGSTVSACTAYGNSTYGIAVAQGCTVAGCTVSENDTNGISALTGSTITGCTSRANTLDGILVSSACVVRQNTCNSNGNGGDGAGVHATGSDNRIEQNACTGGDRGFDVDGIGNIIIANSSAGATVNWSVAASNKVGPIVAAPDSALISGDTGGAGVGSTNPWANFTY